MRHRPDESDQLVIAIEGCVPALHKKLGDLGIRNFDELHRFGVQKESDLAQEKKFFSARPTNRNPASGSSNVQVNFVRQPPRTEQFDPFGQPERSGRVNAVRQPLGGSLIWEDLSLKF